MKPDQLARAAEGKLTPEEPEEASLGAGANRWAIVRPLHSQSRMSVRDLIEVLWQQVDSPRPMRPYDTFSRFQQALQLVMSNNDWTCSGADEHGFVTFKHLKKQAAETSRDQFLLRFPVPALQVVDEVMFGGTESVERAESGVQLLTETIHSAAILRYLTRVAFITKRPGNPFAHLISIGRSPKNDITIAVNTVSKVHGYFVPTGDGWHFTDHGSSNGSLLDGEALTAGEHYPLSDGALLQLGMDVTLNFLCPESLCRKARQASLHGPRN